MCTTRLTIASPISPLYVSALSLAGGVLVELDALAVGGEDGEAEDLEAGLLGRTDGGEVDGPALLGPLYWEGDVHGASWAVLGGSA
jgi:hypothetical protein